MGALGSIIGAFGSNKTAPVQYSPTLTTVQNGTINQIPGVQAQANAAVNQYATNLNQASNTINAMQPGDIAQSQAVTNNLANETGTGTFKTLGDYLTGKLGDFASGLAAQGQGANNLALAKLGYGGTGPSSYATDLITNRISSNLAPVFSSLMGGLAGDTSTVLGQDRANAGAVQQGQEYTASIPLRTANLALLPTQANLSILNGITGIEQGQANVAKTNTAGFQSNPDTVARVGNAVGAAGNFVLGNGSGGGSGGGGYNPGFNPMSPGAPGGGSGGGGGVNSSQLMQLLGLL